MKIISLTSAATRIDGVAIALDKGSEVDLPDADAKRLIAAGIVKAAEPEPAPEPAKDPAKEPAPTPDPTQKPGAARQTKTKTPPATKTDDDGAKDDGAASKPAE